MAKGKYADIVDSLPKSFGLEPAYQEKVAALKAKILESDQPAPDELSSEAIEELLVDVSTMLSVLNDNMIRAVGGRIQASRLARIYKDLRIIKRTMEEQEKVTNILLDAYGQLLVEQYEAEDMTSLKLEDGASVRVQLEPHAKVIDREANRKWAIENGLENLLAVPWQTVNALTKSALLEGEEPPAGVEATTYPKIVYTKG